MTRKSKIEYLINKGEKIIYRFRKCDNRLIIEAIYKDRDWEKYKATTEDQQKAGQLIDLLYWKWRIGG